MSDWNQESGAPAPKAGMPTWAKFLLGCGVLMVLMLTTCIGGAAWLGHKIKKDPEGFKKRVEESAMGFAKDLLKAPWDSLRQVVDQLQTDEGAKGFYLANPGLKDRYPTEGEFQEAAKAWRPKLKPLPPEIPNLMEGHLNFHKSFGSTQRMDYRTPEGAKISIEWQLNGSNLGPVVDLQID